MAEADFEGIGTYITSRRNMLAQYIATRLILELCDWSDGRAGVRAFWRWW